MSYAVQLISDDFQVHQTYAVVPQKGDIVYIESDNHPLIDSSKQFVVMSREILPQNEKGKYVDCVLHVVSKSQLTFEAQENI